MRVPFRRRLALPGLLALVAGCPATMTFGTGLDGGAQAGAASSSSSAPAPSSGDDGGATGSDGGLPDAGAVPTPDGGVCIPGPGPGCNGDPEVSSLEGTCRVDGTCACNPGHFRDPGTGLCRLYRDTCAARGTPCRSREELGGSCPDDTFEPGTDAQRLCPGAESGLCCLPRDQVGAPCADPATCGADICLFEGLAPPGGLCTATCFPDESTCPAGSVCLTVTYSQRPGMCLQPCTDDAMCRGGWTCQAFPRGAMQGDLAPFHACWASGTLWGLGLGKSCAEDFECLSARCRAPPGSADRVCTAACDDALPCLPGFACRAGDACTEPGCGSCFL